MANSLADSITSFGLDRQGEGIETDRETPRPGERQVNADGEDNGLQCECGISVCPQESYVSRLLMEYRRRSWHAAFVKEVVGAGIIFGL